MPDPDLAREHFGYSVFLVCGLRFCDVTPHIVRCHHQTIVMSGPMTAIALSFYTLELPMSFIRQIPQ